MTSRGENPTGHGPSWPMGLLAHIEEWEQSAVDYLDGRLSPEDKNAVEQHLADCPECAARMAAQQSIVTLLQGTVHDEAPEDLEDRVLGDLLFPKDASTLPAFRGIDLERRPEKKGLWRRFRPWIPVTGMVAAVLVGIVAYGVVSQRSGTDVADQQVATSRAAAESADAGADTLLAGSSDTVTTAAGMVTTTAAAATETTEPAPGDNGGYIASASVPMEIRDRNDMIKELEASGSAVYLAFEAMPDDSATSNAPGENGTTVPPAAGEDASKAVSREAAEEVATQITVFTELEQLPTDLSLGGPTYAAYVSKNQMRQFLDLLLSIKSSCGVDLVLRLEPISQHEDSADAIVEHKAQYPVMVGKKTPSPAVNQFGFTTSTLAPAGQPMPDLVPPDEDGTYVLVVIFVRR